MRRLQPTLRLRIQRWGRGDTCLTTRIYGWSLHRRLHHDDGPLALHVLHEVPNQLEDCHEHGAVSFPVVFAGTLVAVYCAPGRQIRLEQMIIA